METTLCKALLLSLLLAPPAPGASGTASTVVADPMQQVVVEATRTNLAKLAKEIEIAEFRFYQRYNELNTKPDYAIHCSNEASTGTRFKENECRPVFRNKAEQVAARDFLVGLGQASLKPGEGGLLLAPPPPATMAILAGQPAYQKNMIEVTGKNPDLIKLLTDHATLVKRFDDMQRQLMGLQPRPEKKAAEPAAPAAGESATDR